MLFGGCRRHFSVTGRTATRQISYDPRLGRRVSAMSRFSRRWFPQMSVRITSGSECRVAFLFGHAAPYTERFGVSHGVPTAVGGHGALCADGLGTLLAHPPLDTTFAVGVKKCRGVGGSAICMQLPVPPRALTAFGLPSGHVVNTVIMSHRAFRSPVTLV